MYVVEINNTDGTTTKLIKRTKREADKAAKNLSKLYKSVTVSPI